jgi:hypothetical protein
MIMSAKEYAFKDMASVGVSVSYLCNELSILEFTKVVDDVGVDFRCFNGGHNKKSNNK